MSSRPLQTHIVVPCCMHLAAKRIGPQFLKMMLFQLGLVLIGTWNSGKLGPDFRPLRRLRDSVGACPLTIQVPQSRLPQRVVDSSGYSSLALRAVLQHTWYTKVSFHRCSTFSLVVVQWIVAMSGTCTTWKARRCITSPP